MLDNFLNIPDADLSNTLMMLIVYADHLSRIVRDPEIFLKLERRAISHMQ